MPATISTFTATLLRLAAAAAAVCSMCTPEHVSAAERTFVGASVGDVLDSLRTQGLMFIYNTELVPPGLRIRSEPQARAGLALAVEVLAEHGLGVARVTSGVYAVTAVRRDPPPERPAPQRTNDAAVEEVIVNASRYTLKSDFAASEALLTDEDIRNVPRLGEETLRAVQRLPGVAANGFSSIGSVRGGEPNETAIVLDGLRLYEPFHLKNFLSPVSLLDSRLIESMHVYSGGFPVIHGERMSAIIEATSVDPPASRYYEAGLSLFHANVLAASEFGQGRGRALLSARRSNLGELAQFSEHDFGKPEYFDGFGKIDYRVSDATRARIELLASSDRIRAVRSSGTERADAEYRNTYIWGTLEHEWAGGSLSRLIASYTDVNNERTGGIDEPDRRSGLVRDDRNFHVIGLRADHAFSAASLDHRLGFEVRRLWGSYDYASDVRFEAGFPFPASPATHVQRIATPTPDGFESGLWWDARARLGSRWVLQAGLRIDTQTYDGSGDAEQIAPRLNILYELDEATSLRASWGKFFQPQAINELQVEDGVDHFWPAQHAEHLILSFERTLNADLNLRIEAYRKDYGRIRPRFENLFNVLALLPEMEFDRVMVAPDSARAEGVELLLRWRSEGPWRGWLGYSWSRARDLIDGRQAPRSWDQTHAVGLGVSWASGPWTVTVMNTYHTGWPITRLSLEAGPGGAVEPIVGPRNATRLDHYNALDVRIARTFALPRGALDVFVEVNNALSRENPCCIDYRIAQGPDGALVLEEDLDTWLPLVPSIGVLWRY
jgi:outer membrane receptor protein involved in Fe transport